MLGDLQSVTDYFGEEFAPADPTRIIRTVRDFVTLFEKALADIKAREEAAQRAAEEARKKEAIAQAVRSKRNSAAQEAPAAVAVRASYQDELHLMALRQVQASQAPAPAAVQPSQAPAAMQQPEVRQPAAASQKEQPAAASQPEQRAVPTSAEGVAPAVTVAGAGQGSAQLAALAAGSSGTVPSPHDAAPQPAAPATQQATGTSLDACSQQQHEQAVAAALEAAASAAGAEQGVAAGPTAQAPAAPSTSLAVVLPEEVLAEQPGTAAGVEAQAGSQADGQATPAVPTPPSLLAAVMRLGDGIAGFLGGGATSIGKRQDEESQAPAQQQLKTHALPAESSSESRGPEAEGTEASSVGDESSAERVEAAEAAQPAPLPAVAAGTVPAGGAEGTQQQEEDGEVEVEVLQRRLLEWPEEYAGWADGTEEEETEDFESVCSSSKASS